MERCYHGSCQGSDMTRPHKETDFTKRVLKRIARKTPARDTKPKSRQFSPQRLTTLTIRWTKVPSGASSGQSTTISRDNQFMKDVPVATGLWLDIHPPWLCWTAINHLFISQQSTNGQVFSWSASCTWASAMGNCCADYEWQSQCQSKICKLTRGAARVCTTRGRAKRKMLFLGKQQTAELKIQVSVLITGFVQLNIERKSATFNNKWVF